MGGSRNYESACERRFAGRVVRLLALCALVPACGGATPAPVEPSSGDGPAAGDPGADPDVADPGETPPVPEEPASVDPAVQEPAADESGGDTTVGVTASAETGETATDATEPEPPPPPLVPGDGSVRIGQPELARGGGRVNGGLFRRQLDRKKNAITTCYNVGLGRNPELEGELSFLLVVDTQGMVGAEVEVDDPAFAEAGVTSCVVSKLRQVDFDDTPPSSELRVRVPIRFTP